MATFAKFCDHYGYDSNSPEARSDYQCYKEEFALLRSLVGDAS